MKDYIETPKVWNQLRANTGPFDPYASLCKAYALEIKGIEYNTNEATDDGDESMHERQCQISDLTAVALYMCRLATLDQRQWTASTSKTMDGLNAVLTRKFTPSPRYMISRRPSSLPVLLSLAICYGINFWVDLTVEKIGTTALRQAGATLLAIAVDYDDFLDDLPGLPCEVSWERKRIRHRPSMDCVAALLSRGVDPGEQYGGISAWSRVVDAFQLFMHDPDVLEDYGIDPVGILGEWLFVAEAFISHGADPSLLRLRTRHLLHEFVLDLWHVYENSDVLQRLCQMLDVAHLTLPPRELEYASNDEDEEVSRS